MTKWFLKAVFICYIFMTFVVLFAPDSAVGRDLDGRYAQQNPELHKWVEGLKSGKGPCCSNADGRVVEDADWRSANGHFQVYLEGSWLNVPDDALITEPNRLGRTMVWPIKMPEGPLIIRCFMPGSMT